MVRSLVIRLRLPNRPGVETHEIVPLVAYPYTPLPVKLIIRVVTAVATGF